MPSAARHKNIYNIVIVGAGPAGIMAALRAANIKKNIAVIEANEAIGKKILITGKGRCNVTNASSLDLFLEKFGKSGRYLRSAFSEFFNEDLIDFFESRGLPLKKERQGRVFPVTDKASSVVDVLNKALKEKNIKVFYNVRLTGLRKEDDSFRLETSGENILHAKKVILATGGASYKATGSRGDGFQIAHKLGHKVAPLVPALVPLKTKEQWVKEIPGLSLKNVRITFVYAKKKIASEIGEMLFTHFGISGPLVLDLSGRIAALLREHDTIKCLIDLKPGLDQDKLRKKLMREFDSKGRVQFKNFMKDLLPQRLVPIFMELSGITPEKPTSDITKPERNTIITHLKAMPLTITGTLGIASAMVTGGGVSVKQIDPRTMESRIVPGLYFAGEIIDGCAPSGGYNLQQAFSTGFLAGESATDA